MKEFIRYQNRLQGFRAQVFGVSGELRGPTRIGLYGTAVLRKPCRFSRIYTCWLCEEMNDHRCHNSGLFFPENKTPHARQGSGDFPPRQGAFSWKDVWV